MARKKIVTSPQKDNKDIWEVRYAEHPFAIIITDEHYARATCKDPTQCVVAQALLDHFHDAVNGFVVGARRAKIFHRGNLAMVYHTSERLRNAIRKFDVGQGWTLPPGTYYLEVVPQHRRASRHNHIKGESKGIIQRSKGLLKGEAGPTRHAPTACQVIRQMRQATAEAV